MEIDSELRQRYLQAMGIQTWTLKSASDSEQLISEEIAGSVEKTERQTVRTADSAMSDLCSSQPPHRQTEIAVTGPERRQPERISPARINPVVRPVKSSSARAVQAQTPEKQTPLPASKLRQEEHKNAGFEVPAGVNPEFEECMAAITHCRLCSQRTDRIQALTGQGPNKKIEVFFITEPPVAEEDRAGKYLPDKAGVLYQAMLKSADLTDCSYVSGILKCHSLEQFVPAEAEMQQCFPYLSAQINILRPRVLVALGRLPSQYLLHTDRCFNELLNQPHKIDIEGNTYPLIVTYHPAYLLRNPLFKKQSFDDLLHIKRLLSESAH